MWLPFNDGKTEEETNLELGKFGLFNFEVLISNLGRDFLIEQSQNSFAYDSLTKLKSQSVKEYVVWRSGWDWKYKGIIHWLQVKFNVMEQYEIIWRMSIEKYIEGLNTRTI